MHRGMFHHPHCSFHVQFEWCCRRAYTTIDQFVSIAHHRLNSAAEPLRNTKTCWFSIFQATTNNTICYYLHKIIIHCYACGALYYFQTYTTHSTHQASNEPWNALANPIGTRPIRDKMPIRKREKSKMQCSIISWFGSRDRCDAKQQQIIIIMHVSNYRVIVTILARSVRCVCVMKI